MMSSRFRMFNKSSAKQIISPPKTDIVGVLWYNKCKEKLQNASKSLHLEWMRMYRYSNGQIRLSDFKQPMWMNLKEENSRVKRALLIHGMTLKSVMYPCSKKAMLPGCCIWRLEPVSFRRIMAFLMKKPRESQLLCVTQYSSVLTCLLRDIRERMKNGTKNGIIRIRPSGGGTAIQLG